MAWPYAKVPCATELKDGRVCGHIGADHESTGSRVTQWCWGAGETDDEMGWPICSCPEYTPADSELGVVL